jgi:AcrR family transcriptional regulator
MATMGLHEHNYWWERAMARTAGRAPDQTRRALLDAAARIVRERGVSARLDEIAQAAGVSKGGLLYYYANKDELLDALACDMHSSFRDRVKQELDPDDPGPGALTRAYVRAALAPRIDTSAFREGIALQLQLIVVPRILAMTQRDNAIWRAELGTDGLPAHIVSLVVAAADGASLGPVWGGPESDAKARRIVTQLDRILSSPDLWAALDPARQPAL